MLTLCGKYQWWDKKTVFLLFHYLSLPCSFFPSPHSFLELGSADLTFCSSSQHYFTLPLSRSTPQNKKKKVIFFKLACVVSLHVPRALDIESSRVSLGKGKRLRTGEERMAGQAFTLWDFAPGYVRFSLRRYPVRVKGTFKGGAIPNIFQSILKWMQKQNDKASGLGANSLLDEANRCLQSSDFLRFATDSPVKAALTACPWTQ